MAIIGRPIDRVDGQLKVTGAAKYAAEFSVPDAVHAVLVQSTIARRNDHRLRPDGSRGHARRAGDHHPRQCRQAVHRRASVPQAVPGPLLQNKDVHYNGQHVAVVVAEPLEQAQAAAARVRVTYSNGEAATSMDALLGQAYPPKNFRNGARPPDSLSRRSGRRIRRRGGAGWMPLTSRRSNITMRWSRMRRSRRGTAIG